MAKNIDSITVTPQMADIIRKTAEKLMASAAKTAKEPLLAVGALLLAGGSAAALAKIPYSDVVELISTYYEAMLLNEVELTGQLTTRVSRGPAN